MRSPRFRRVVAPTAPWVFAAPAIAFALLPSVVGAARATDGIALTAAITAVCAVAGIMIQPFATSTDAAIARRWRGCLSWLRDSRSARSPRRTRQSWLLVPSAVVLGSAYGLCLVAGLVEIQRLAGDRALAGLTAAFYALAYLGFAAPYLLSAGVHLASYNTLLAITAGLALLTAWRSRAIAGTERPRCQHVPAAPDNDYATCGVARPQTLRRSWTRAREHRT